MRISSLDRYVKFIFSCDEDGFCASTCDRTYLNYVKSVVSGTSPMDYKIGDKIYFEPHITNYEVIDIAIRQLVEDTETFKYGFDSEDCSEIQGAKKDFLFSIKISLKLV